MSLDSVDLTRYLIVERSYSLTADGVICDSILHPLPPLDGIPTPIRGPAADKKWKDNFFYIVLL